MQFGSAQPGETLYQRAHAAAAQYVAALAEHKCGRPQPDDVVCEIATRMIDTLSTEELQALLEARSFTPSPDLHWRVDNSLDRLIAFCAAVRYAEIAQCDFSEDELVMMRDGILLDLRAADDSSTRLLFWPAPATMLAYFKAMLVDVPPAARTPASAQAEIVMIVRHLSIQCPREARQ